MKKILFVSTRYPIPVFGGDKNRTVGILKFLSKKNKVDFVTLIKKNQNRTNELSFCNNVKVFEINNLFSRLTKAVVSMLSGKPLQIGFYYSKELKEYINKVEKNYNTIVFHQLRGSQYLSKNFKGKKVLEMTDLQSLNYQQVFERLYPLNPLKYIYALEKYLIRKYEKRVVKLFDKIVFISKKDSKKAGQILGYKKKIAYVRNGCDLNKNLFKYHKSNYKILFLGNIKYLPNKYACYHFAKNILPRLNELYAKFEFHIVGEINYFDKFKLKRCKNVIVYGPIKNLNYIIKIVSCAICNINIATGSQLKILTYMSYGIPTISSSISFKDTNLKKNKEIMVYKNDDELIQNIEKIVQNKKLAKNLSVSSHKVIKNKYKWDKIFSKYNNII